jgi:glycine cleavage system H protein
MAEFPGDLKYATSHEWVRIEEDGTATVGISDHAQEALGDVVFVELPELELVLSVGDEAGVVESVKAASDIYAPISGTIIEVNPALEDQPEIVNEEPHDKGWFFKMKPADLKDLDNLLDADAYQALCESEEH